MIKKQHPNFLSKKISWLYVVLFSFVFGLLFSFASHQVFKRKQVEISKSDAEQQHVNIIAKIDESFINPALSCSVELPELKPFKSKIEDIVNRCKAEGKAKEISVYFRSMNNGYVFGINRREKYYPASLLKVPLMMAYLRQAAMIPGFLERKLKFEKRFEGVPVNNVPNKIELGKIYSIGELIERMIIVSDNDATALLDHNISNLAYRNTLKELGLNIPQKSTRDQNFLILEDYARVLRILYNASYLNRKLSNYALKILSNAEFGDGLVAGISNTAVSHKYGEWAFNGEFQLHDCGIVYETNQPYILCVMSKGKDSKVLSGIIAEISKVVNESVRADKVPAQLN